MPPPVGTHAAAGALHERRVGQKAVPEDIHTRLNELQRMALQRLEGFGWRVLFVRRPRGMAPTVVVGDAAAQDVAVLTPEGLLDRTVRIHIR